MEGLILAGEEMLELNGLTVLFRLTLSLSCGALLGFERLRKRRGAGVRTYILVCMASAMVMMTSQFINQNLPYSTDTGRMGAQVISGIGFLGAGTILLTGQHRIRGITTAAGLWVSTCIGLALGIGFYFGGISLCIFSFFTMTAIGVYQDWFMRHSKRMQIYLVLEDVESMAKFMCYVRQHEMVILDFEIMNTGEAGAIGMTCLVKAERGLSHGEMFSRLKACPEIWLMEEF
ncbi:MgtC/SapB family protein [Cuneatibacter sp. NSJ-177]|uniref:MgtC/SapB family protein n=1 Tax=Cuneatibacter sp. NSJ-177 TaxID=2931401 RepID=UPI001FD027C1|nr:MgtC/SapB family protein [Cuneatibacter sp. NSJ-177]MCJ7834356.1 MgtC/SapB family protein [Cuneatibacter sp. NSJ-177]